MQTTGRSLQVGVGVALSLVLGSLIWAWASASGAQGTGIQTRAVTVNVAQLVPVHPIRGGFAGLSLEYTTVMAYAGTDPAAVDPVFEQLVRNISPGQRPVIRIGGDTTDWTWWPVPGVSRPPWVRYTLNARWMAVTRAFSDAVHARLLPGLNLEANSRAVVAAEANAMLGGLGPKAIVALELGNEPELYGSFSWYRTRSGRKVRGRAKGYDFARFARDFRTVATGIPARIPLAGPGTGGEPKWTNPLARFLDQEPRVDVVTMHRYGLNGCLRLVPISALVSDDAQRGLALSVAPETRIAHAHHAQLRVEEMNTVACGGQRGVSNTFAAALWLLDTLFEAARVGVDGVNVHTNPPGANVAATASLQHSTIPSHQKSPGLNSLFDFHQVGDQWQGSVRPEYYGMMMFAQAAPAGSRLLTTSQSPHTGTLHTWATRAPNGKIRIVLINESLRQPLLVKIGTAAANGRATLERLSAPSLSATSGTTLGGHGFGRSTTTGSLPAPVQITIAPSGRTYAVRLPATSAAMITFRAPA